MLLALVPLAHLLEQPQALRLVALGVARKRLAIESPALPRLVALRAALIHHHHLLDILQAAAVVHQSTPI